MSRTKAKGTAAETAVVNYLRDNGHPQAERRALHGSNDKGDIANIPGFALEVKAAATARYDAWLREAATERDNAGARWGAVVHKPAGIGTTRVGEWRVVMTLETFNNIIHGLSGPPVQVEYVEEGQ